VQMCPPGALEPRVVVKLYPVLKVEALR